MGIFDHYQYERTPRVPKGYYWAELCDVNTDPSRKGDPMITITVRLNKQPGLRIKDYMSQASEYFNRNVSRVCDCFGVEAEDEKIPTWPGAIGVVHLKEDGEYMRIDRYVAKEDVGTIEGLGQWEGPMPERQTITSIPRSDAASPQDDDELPF